MSCRRSVEIILLTASLLILSAAAQNTGLPPEPPAPIGRQLPRDEQLRQQAEYVKTHPPRESVGLIALTDLGPGYYQGEQGGLYPGGVNVPPPAHLRDGVRISRTVVPLDADGKKSKNGKIVFMSIGFSNPNIEFTAFKKAADADPRENPHLVIVNGCVGGQAAQTIADPNAKYWTAVGAQIKAGGVTPQQVEVIWLKLVNPVPQAGFPAEAKRLQRYYVRILNLIHNRFPNVKLAYLATRIYSGFAENGGSPEPYAYETGFAVKWVIADQIDTGASLFALAPDRALWEELTGRTGDERDNRRVVAGTWKGQPFEAIGAPMKGELRVGPAALADPMVDFLTGGRNDWFPSLRAQGVFGNVLFFDRFTVIVDMAAYRFGVLKSSVAPNEIPANGDPGRKPG